MFVLYTNARIDHDDRSERKADNFIKDNRRRVSFKPSGAGPPGNRQNNFKGYAELAIRSRLEDDDEMIDFPANGRSDGNVINFSFFFK